MKSDINGKRQINESENSDLQNNEIIKVVKLNRKCVQLSHHCINFEVTN